MGEVIHIDAKRKRRVSRAGRGALKMAIEADEGEVVIRFDAACTVAYLTPAVARVMLTALEDALAEVERG